MTSLVNFEGKLALCGNLHSLGNIISLVDFHGAN